MNNFGVQAGVIRASADGYFKIYRSNITQNYAIAMPIMEIFISSQQSIISNSTISFNVAYDKDFVMSELTNCTTLCFFSDSFKAFLLNHETLLDINPILYSIQSISSNLMINENTIVENQNSFLSAYLSSITLKDSSISKIETDGIILRLTESFVQIQNFDASEIMTSTSGLLLSPSIYTQLMINKLIFHDSSAKLMRSYSASIDVSNLSVYNTSMSEDLISFMDCKVESFQNVDLKKVWTQREGLISSTQTNFSSILDIQASDIANTIFAFSRSIISMASNIHIVRVAKAMHLQGSMLTLQSSQFIE